MSVFRIERNKGYTVMSNYHLRDTSLSLKAKGLLSQMLSLPEEWDYTLSGLAHINREGKDAIRSSVNELEQAGYIRRQQTRCENGGFSVNEYIIYEQPMLAAPSSEKPSTAVPSSENPTQLKKEQINNDPSITDPFPSPTPSQPDCMARERREATTEDEISEIEDLIRENIEYDELIEETPAETELIDELVQIMVETICSKRKTLRIGGTPYHVEVIRNRLLKLDREHIRFVMNCMRENTTQIRNIRQYLLTVLFNAPSTIGNFYATQVNHDLAHPS